MRKYFVTGLLILVPLVITVWVISMIVGTLDQSLLLLPVSWRPEALVGFHIQTDEMTQDGFRFRVETFVDDTQSALWKYEDGHGPVSQWTGQVWT